MLPSFCSQSIVRKRAGVTQSRGSDIPNWNTATSATISPVSVQPSSSTVSLDGRVLGVSDSWTVYCNPDVDVVEGDHIEFDGETYLVNEAPRKWTSPSGLVSSLQFTMVRYDG